MSSKLLKFTGDTSVYCLGIEKLYKTIKTNMSEKWQMLFDFGKCQRSQIGHGNMDEECKMGDTILSRMTGFIAIWNCGFK